MFVLFFCFGIVIADTFELQISAEFNIYLNICIGVNARNCRNVRSERANNALCRNKRRDDEGDSLPAESVDY